MGRAINMQHLDDGNLFEIPDEFRIENQPLDLKLAADTEISEIQPFLRSEHTLFIVVDSFTDGRVFSLGKQLRIDGFSGKLIAVGDFLPDQLGQLEYCGFNGYGNDIDQYSEFNSE